MLLVSSLLAGCSTSEVGTVVQGPLDLYQNASHLKFFQGCLGLGEVKLSKFRKFHLPCRVDSHPPRKWRESDELALGERDF